MKKKNDDFGLNNNMSRREMLKAFGGLTAGALSFSFMPFNVRKVLAHPPDMGNSLQDIEHVVLLMQENRSFDHYFGTLSGVRGFDDPNPMMLNSGRSVFTNLITKILTIIYSHSIWIRANQVLKKYLQQVTHGERFTHRGIMAG